MSILRISILRFLRIGEVITVISKHVIDYNVFEKKHFRSKNIIL